MVDGMIIRAEIAADVGAISDVKEISRNGHSTDIQHY